MATNSDSVPSSAQTLISQNAQAIYKEEMYFLAAMKKLQNTVHLIQGNMTRANALLDTLSPNAMCETEDEHDRFVPAMTSFQANASAQTIIMLVHLEAMVKRRASLQQAFRLALITLQFQLPARTKEELQDELMDAISQVRHEHRTRTAAARNGTEAQNQPLTNQ
jgi:hypothetical protein